MGANPVDAPLLREAIEGNDAVEAVRDCVHGALPTSAGQVIQAVPAQAQAINSAVCNLHGST